MIVINTANSSQRWKTDGKISIINKKLINRHGLLNNERNAAFPSEKNIREASSKKRFRFT